jgi:Fe-S-cluster containining protein
MTPDDRLRELWHKIDAFSVRVALRYPKDMVCGPGCADCCQRRLTVTGVEARAIAELVGALPRETRNRMAHRAQSSGPACPALEDDGRCAIYDARPVVCRSHGLPIRFPAEADAKVRLPLIDVCPKNFTAHALEAIDATCVLDQATLSTLLAAINATFEPNLRNVRRPLESLLDAIAPAEVDAEQ